MNKKCVVLLSGGIDSTTILAIAKKEGYRLFAITFNYGQRHYHEIEAAKKVSKNIGVEEHIIIDINMKMIGGSALTDNIVVPKSRSLEEISSEKIPPTYVPARNLIFLSFALSYAEVIGADDIFIGANAIDYSGYPDCRPLFIKEFEKIANIATKAGAENGRKFKIHAPILFMKKSEIIKQGIEFGVDYSLTHTCYDPDEGGFACGRCDSCILRIKGFNEAGIEDPIRYRV